MSSSLGRWGMLAIPHIADAMMTGTACGKVESPTNVSRDRQVSVARHTTYNVVGALTPVVVSLVTVPLYLKTVGLDRYGILNLCWLLVGYFALFDFGMGKAT